MDTPPGSDTPRRRPPTRGPLSDEEIRSEFLQAHAETQNVLNLTHRLVGMVGEVKERLATVPTREEFHAALSATPPEVQAEMLRLQRENVALSRASLRWTNWRWFAQGIAVPVIAFFVAHLPPLGQVAWVHRLIDAGR